MPGEEMLEVLYFKDPFPSEQDNERKEMEKRAVKRHSSFNY